MHIARFILLFILLSFVLFSPSEAHECLITVNTSGSDQIAPAISGDLIAWQDYRNGNPDIYLYDIATGKETRITQDSFEHTLPAISGSLVAWEENLGIAFLRLPNLVEAPLASSGFTPATYGDMVVWADTRDGDSHIYLYNTTEGEEAPITSEPGLQQINPAVGEYGIVWLNTSIDPVTYLYGPADLYFNATPSGSALGFTNGSIVTGTASPMSPPAISRNRIAWADNRNGVSEIYLYDLTSGMETKITADQAEQIAPSIDGTRVAWVNTSDSAIYLGLNMAGLASPRSVIGSGGVNDLPRISSDRVVWQKYAGGHYDIYLHTINSPEPCPVATFMANATSGMAPLAVQFSDISGDPNTTHWSWEFGDGTTADGQNPVHTYGTDGTYSVSLTVSNMVGRDYTTRTDYIRVGPVPIVSFLANQTYGIAPLPVQFTDTSSGNPTSWSWDFGDGNTSSAQNPIYTYPKWGNYTVSLAATNINGTGTASMPGLIQVLNGTSLTATTAIDGLQGATLGSRDVVTLDTTENPGYTFDPNSPSSFSFTPPASSGWQRITFSSTDGIGFARDASGNITGNYTSCTLESREIVPTTFGTGVGNNLPISYQLQLATYPLLGEVNATIWEGVMNADKYPFWHTLVTTSTQFTSIMATAYTLNFTTNITGATATLNLSVSSDWVTRNGNQNNITVIRLGDDLVNQTLNPSATFTDTANNLDYFVIPSPNGLSRFALVSATGSSNLIQIGTRLATQLIQGSGIGYTSGGSSGGEAPPQEKPPQPAKAPAERPAATFYGEGKIDTTPAGIVRDPVIITSTDHGASLAIDAGTAAFDSMHVPLTLATARAVTTGSIPAMPGGAGIQFTGMAYDIGPDGATFNPPATISFTVPDNLWDTNTQYAIRSYSTKTGSWDGISTMADPGTRTVSGQVSHLCLFGLFTAPLAGPATPAPPVRASAGLPQAQPKPLPRTPMGTFTGLLGWIYAAAISNIPVSFTIVLSGLAAIYASTRRAWLSRNRTWITLYLISLTGLLWALFLAASDGPPWESAWILITVTGLNLIVHILRFDRIDLSSRARRGYVEIGRR